MAFVCLAVSSATIHATTYYVASNGSDSNDGTSPSTPWQTYHKAHSVFASLDGGDQILFRRGDSFTLSGLYTWYNDEASAASPITIGDYGDLEDDRPVIQPTSTGGTHCGFYFENDTTSFVGGFVVKNLVVQGPGKAQSSAGPRGVRFRGSFQDVIVDNVKTDGLRYGVQFQYFDYVKAPRRMTLKNSQILNIEEFGFSGGGDDFTIEYNYWENCGTAGPEDHHIYITSTGTETSNLVIRGNEMTGALQPGNSSNGPDSQPIKVAGLIDGCLIEDNLIWEDPTADENDDGGSTVPAFIVGRSNSGSINEYYNNVTIRNNKVFNIPGLLWSFAGGQGYVVEGNIVISESYARKRIGIGYAALGSGDQPLDNVTIRNNEFLFKVAQGETISEAYGIALPPTGNNHVVTGNKIKFTGPQGSWYALDLDPSGGYSNYDDVDDNQFYYPNSSGDWEKDEGNLSAWRSASPWGDNSSNSDPNFSYESNSAPLYGFSSPLDASTPGAPSGVSATAGNSQVNLSWTSVSGASSYRVKRSSSIGGPYSTIEPSIGATSYADTTVSNGTTYYYVVSSLSSGGESSDSSETSATPSASGGSIGLAWEFDSNLDGWVNGGGSLSSFQWASGGYANGTSTGDARIYSADNLGESILSSHKIVKVRFKNSSSDTVGYLYYQVSGDSQFTAGKRAEFTTIANDSNYTEYTIDMSGDVAWTGTLKRLRLDPNQLSGSGSTFSLDYIRIQSDALDAPSGLGATAGDGEVSLSWTASSGASSYNVKRATVSGGGYSTIASGVTGTSYIDTTPSNGTTYYYVVSAQDGGTESSNSSEASAMPQVTVPPVPTGLAAIGGDGLVNLSWSASSSAASYTLKRSTSSGGSYSVLASGLSSLSYSDTGVVNGTTYYYVVSAVNPGGESANSTEASAIPAATGSTGVAW